MVQNLTDKTITHFRAYLKRRHSELVNTIKGELKKWNFTHYTTFSDRVHDIGEESVANLLMDIDLIEINHFVEELKDVESAIERIRKGKYGICINCGDVIAIKRLNAYPTAKRCHACQSKYEATTHIKSRVSNDYW